MVPGPFPFLVALLLCAAAVALPARPADAPTIVSTRHGDAIEIRASVRLAADRTTAWHVLTDYARYVEFIPDLHTSRVVARNGRMIVVEQEGSARFGPLHIPLAITFLVEERPPQELASRAVAGSLEALESRYALIPEAGGTRLLYHGIVRPGFPFAARFAQSAIEAHVRRQFLALVDEIERRPGVDAPERAPR